MKLAEVFERIEATNTLISSLMGTELEKNALLDESIKKLRRNINGFLKSRVARRKLTFEDFTARDLVLGEPDEE